MWTYGLFDYDPDLDGTEEEWASRMAEQGWQMWTPGRGQWVDVGGRHVRRWNLRRQVEHHGSRPPPLGR